MAAKQLDEVWDGQVAILNTSYAKTLALLDQDKIKDAADEFHGNFAPAVKKIFSEAAQACPERFSKFNDWSSWVKNLYVASAKADKALAAGNSAEASKGLASLRASFYKLHQDSQTLKAPDFVYALAAEAQQDQPAASVIKDLDAKLGTMASTAQPADFSKAKSTFDAKAGPLLADDKIDANELPALRAAAEAFYKAYGIQFE